MTGAILVIAGTARNSIIHRDMMCIAQGTSRQLGTDEPPPIDLESRDRSSDRLKNIPGRLFDERDTRSHWLLGLSPQDFSAGGVHGRPAPFTAYVGQDCCLLPALSADLVRPADRVRNFNGPGEVLLTRGKSHSDDLCKTGGQEVCGDE